MLKTKLIGLKPEIFAENTAWIWSQLKLHLRMISSKNSSKEVRNDFKTRASLEVTYSETLELLWFLIIPLGSLGFLKFFGAH